MPGRDEEFQYGLGTPFDVDSEWVPIKQLKSQNQAEW
jgi:hypothetical protein